MRQMRHTNRRRVVPEHRAPKMADPAPTPAAEGDPRYLLGYAERKLAFAFTLVDSLAKQGCNVASRAAGQILAAREDISEAADTLERRPVTFPDAAELGKLD